MSSTTLFLCTCTSSLSARAFSNVDPSFSAIGLTVLQIVPFKKMNIVRQAIMNQSLTRLPGWMFSTLRGLFSSVSITKIGNSVWFLILNLETHFVNSLLIMWRDLSHHFECWTLVWSWSRCCCPCFNLQTASAVSRQVGYAVSFLSVGCVQD